MTRWQHGFRGRGKLLKDTHPDEHATCYIVQGRGLVVISREYTIAGGLISYGVDLFRQIALYAAQILKVPSLVICPSYKPRSSIL